LSYERVQDIIYATHLPTIVAQNTLKNVIGFDGIVTWRNTAVELLNVIQSLLEHICPAMVVLVESTENVTISLSTVLPNELTLTGDVKVNVKIVQYSNHDNLTNKIKNIVTNASSMINPSSTINARCVQNQFQFVFILNSPVYDVHTILTMVSN